MSVRFEVRHIEINVIEHDTATSARVELWETVVDDASKASARQVRTVHVEAADVPELQRILEVLRTRAIADVTASRSGS